MVGVTRWALLGVALTGCQSAKDGVLPGDSAFSQPEPVIIEGYSGHAMEPVIEGVEIMLAGDFMTQFASLDRYMMF